MDTGWIRKELCASWQNVDFPFQQTRLYFVTIAIRRIRHTCVCLSHPGHQFYSARLFSQVFKPQLCPDALQDCLRLMLWSTLPVLDQLCLSSTTLPSSQSCLYSPGFLSAWFSDPGAVTVWITHKIRLLTRVIIPRITACWGQFLRIVCHPYSWTVEPFSYLIKLILPFRLSSGVLLLGPNTSFSPLKFGKY